MASTRLTVTKKRDFSDLPLIAILHPNKKDLLPLKGNAAIKQAVKNLVLTNFGERPFQPFFGGNVVAHLFENTDNFTKRSIIDAIQRVLVKEPRITVSSIAVDFRPDNNTLAVTITFNIVGVNEIETVEISLNRTR
jgi:phage baseplate assembly protein W